VADGEGVNRVVGECILDKLALVWLAGSNQRGGEGQADPPFQTKSQASPQASSISMPLWSEMYTDPLSGSAPKVHFESN